MAERKLEVPEKKKATKKTPTEKKVEKKIDKPVAEAVAEEKKPVKHMIYAKCRVNMRAKPTKESNIVLVINQDEAFEDLGAVGNKWTKISYKGEIGFVMTEYTYKK